MSFTLYLMRHGIAEDFDPTRMHGDADRHLTEEGRERLEKEAKGLAKLDLDVAQLITSPYARAKETAHIVQSHIGKKLPMEVTEALVPHAPVDAILEELQAASASQPTMVFGHEPLFSSIIAHVLGDKHAMIEMKKGALAALEIGRLQPPFRGQLLFLLPPRVLRAMA